MLTPRAPSVPGLRGVAASRLLDTLRTAWSSHRSFESDEDLEGFLFVLDVSAFSTLGRPITDLPWVRHFDAWYERDELPSWVVRIEHKASTGNFPNPRTPYLSGLEAAFVRRVAEAWREFGEPDRSAVFDYLRHLKATTDASASLWDLRTIRTGREAALRERLHGLELKEAPKPTHTDEEDVAIADAVLDTILSAAS